VEAASGPLLRTEHASIHAPEGFRVLDDLVSWLKTAQDPDGYTQVSLASRPATGTTDLDDLARIARDTTSFPRAPRQLPHAELGGVEVYHLAGVGNADLYFEEFGAVSGGVRLTLQLKVDRRLPATERTELVESVLASFAWS
jgi:hypothetical protein